MEKITGQLERELTFDLYGRYATIRDIIDQNRKNGEKFRILDVGGRGNLLKRFLPDDEVFYLDPFVDSNDSNFIKGDGCAMRLEDESFDWVTSADVFEHIPKEKREAFLNENIRVARLAVILVAPFWSKEVEQAEINANDNYKILSKGKSHIWLREHIENGLPEIGHLEKILKSRKLDFQKFSNNELLLWQMLINTGFMISDNPSIDIKIKEEFEDFNYFYNKEIYPFDNQELSYRKVYFIKKDHSLVDLKKTDKTIDTNLFLRVFKKGLDLTNRMHKIKNDVVEQKNCELSSIHQLVKEKDEQISAKDRAREIINKDLDVMKSQLNLKIDELSEIKRSRSWKLVGYLVKISNVILPKGSLRREVLSSSFKVCIGSVASIRKVEKRLERKIIQPGPRYLVNKSISIYRNGGFKCLIKRTINYLGLIDSGNRKLLADDNMREKRSDIFGHVMNFNNNRLTITAFVPFDFRPDIFGGSVRVMNVYKGLSKYFNVNLVGVKGYDNNPEKIIIDDNLILYMIPMSREYYEKLDSEQRRIGAPLHDVLFTDDYNMIPDLVRLCRHLKVESDVCISSHPYFHKMLSKYCSDKVLIYDAHNVDYDIKKSYLSSSNSKDLDGYLLAKVDEAEYIACIESDLIFSVSNNDSTNLFKRYEIDPKKIIKVPNGIDVESYRFIQHNMSDKICKNRCKKILFIGSAHEPNFEAVDFILEILAPKDKKIEYIIIGNVDSHYQSKRIPKNVRFVGVVSDKVKEKLFEDCDLAINPMFSGSGTNIKVLEYVARGIPVVSTSFGMRGLEAFNGRVYLAERDHFREKVNEVLAMPCEMKEKNSVFARRVCEKTFDRVAIVRDCIEKIRELSAKNSGKIAKIAIEGRILHRNISGTERYISEIVKYVAGAGNNYGYDFLLVNDLKCSFFGVPMIPNLLDLPKIDLYHRTYQVGNPLELAEQLVANKSVITYHDLISYKHPDYFDLKEDHEKYLFLMKASLEASDRIIAISKHSRNDIMETLGITGDKIDVIYDGVNLDKFSKVEDAKEVESFREEFKLPKKYLLFIGTDYPHKNLKNLYIAFSKIFDHPVMRDYFLLTVGNNYYVKGQDYLKPFLEPIEERVVQLGHFPDEKMKLLYNASSAFVFPSLYEGFGLPILEAFACGVPVICSDATSLSEVAGDSAYMVDASEPEQISQAILKIIENPKLREDLIRKGFERAQLFPWKKCADETFVVYQKTLSAEKKTNASNISNLEKLSKQFPEIDFSRFKLSLLNSRDLVRKGAFMDAGTPKELRSDMPRLKLAVLFLEYDNGKYKDAFRLLQSYVDKIDDCDKEYFIIDNLKEGDSCLRVSRDVYRIGGDNRDWEFSGWQKGVNFLKENNIESDIVLFVNDAFMAYGWNFIQEGVTGRSLEKVIKDEAVVGHIDTKGIKMKIFGKEVTKWLCSNCFFVPAKMIRSLDTMVSVDDVMLTTIVPKEYKKGTYFKDISTIDKNYKDMVVMWLTKEWHGKFEINERNWGLFKNKLKAMLNESMLTAKIKDLGYKVESYKNYFK